MKFNLSGYEPILYTAAGILVGRYLGSIWNWFEKLFGGSNERVRSPGEEGKG